MSTTKRTRTHAGKGGKRVAVCEANIPVVECQYKKDLNHWAGEFTKVNTKLDAIQYIKLNGDDKDTDFSTIIRDIYHATISARETHKMIKQFKSWTEKSKTGRFLRTYVGKAIITFILLWIGYSTLHVFGVIETTPKEFVFWLAGKLKIS